MGGISVSKQLIGRMQWVAAMRASTYLLRAFDRFLNPGDIGEYCTDPMAHSSPLIVSNTGFRLMGVDTVSHMATVGVITVTAFG